jgi:hypothetical protein
MPQLGIDGSCDFEAMTPTPAMFRRDFADRAITREASSCL